MSLSPSHRTSIPLLGRLLLTLGMATATSRAADNPLAKEMKFQRFVINDDPTYTGMEVTRGILPAGWKLQGGVVWDLRDAFPAQFRIHAADPQDVSAIDVYPKRFFYWSALAQRQGMAGPDTRYMGEIVAPPPSDQFDALRKVIIAQFRPELANAQVVEQEKQPKVAEAAFNTMLQAPQLVNKAWAGRVRFEYDLKGHAVQEDVYVILKSATNARLHYMSWSVEGANSVRAPKGKLDELKLMQAVMNSAARPNVLWFNKVNQFILMRQKMTLDQRRGSEARLRAGIPGLRNLMQSKPAVRSATTNPVLVCE